MPAHLKCISKWMSKKCLKKKKNMVYYDYSKLKCDLCQTQYPVVINDDGNTSRLINLVPEEICSFVVLDVHGNEEKVIKGSYVIKLKSDN